jgi:hypothetical protein
MFSGTQVLYSTCEEYGVFTVQRLRILLFDQLRCQSKDWTNMKVWNNSHWRLAHNLYLKQTIKNQNFWTGRHVKEQTNIFYLYGAYRCVISKFSRCIQSNTTRQILIKTRYIGDMFRLILQPSSGLKMAAIWAETYCRCRVLLSIFDLLCLTGYTY